MSRIIVTGCAGFIGSHLCELLLNRHHQVIGIDNFLPESYDSKIKIKNLSQFINHPNFRFYEMDLTQKIEKDFFQDGDTVINEAAIPGLPLSWSNPELYFKQNTFLPINILNSFSKLNLKKFIQISTSSVYGKFAVGDENLILNPSSPYGVSKLAAEKMIENYCNNMKIDFAILRYFSVFGPRQRPDMAYHQIIKKILLNQPIEIFGDGKQTRTNTYVKDIALGTIQALTEQTAGKIYNLAGSKSVTLLETIEFISAELQVKFPKIVHLPERDGDQRETKGVFEKASRDFAYNPATDFWVGLKSQIEYQIKIYSEKSSL